MPRRSQTSFTPLEYTRPFDGVSLVGLDEAQLPLTGKPAWRSNGGPNRSHPARSFPFTLEANLSVGVVVRVHLLGVFALHCSKEQEVKGTLGASFQLIKDGQIVIRQELTNGRHYEDARSLEPIDRILGDGTSIETIGTVDIDGALCRVDLLTVDVPPHTSVDTLKLKDLGSPASFVIFDIFVESVEAGCPFHSGGGGIALGEIGALVRLGDRVRFAEALDQLEKSLSESLDLDDARGQGLTFLAMVTAAMLEVGGDSSLHREQLEAARIIDRVQTQAEVATVIRQRVERVSESMFKEQSSPSSYLVDRALALVERNFAKNLSDSIVARQLGLSTSHFRFLFRQATGQPFHKYLIALRLEKARQMLIEQEVSVGAVAKAVGFAGLSHFSRAFTQRFSVSPTSIRRGGS